jgi:phage shock protein E
MNDNMIYIFIVIAIYMGYKHYKYAQVIKIAPDLLKEGAKIIDVRTMAEFNSGHKDGSINIPLDQLNKKLDELPKDKPIILCCASGTRSGHAMRAFIASGFEKVYNAGSWRSLTKI